MSSSQSAFNWRNNPRPSIFATDPTFCGTKKTGKTMSQVSSESVEKVTKRTGKNPGSIYHLSTKGNALIEESNHKRRNAK